MGKTLIITLQREKCIGCGYCEQVAAEFFSIDEQDGKTSLLNSEEKKGFWTLKTPDTSLYDDAKSAEENCPVNIIKLSFSSK